MESLVIKNASSSKIRKGMGIFKIIMAIFWIVSFVYSHKIFELVQFFLWAFLGVYHFTEGFGLEEEFAEVLENGLNVKLQNKTKPILILNSDIEKIILRKLEIVVYQVNNKPVRFKRKYLEQKQMNEVYKFFIEYASTRNIELIRDFN
jgi:hypothetical protein